VSPLKTSRDSNYARVEPIIEPLLTQDIEDSFLAKKKTGAVFIDLTVAYDTIWHCSLTCKLLRLLPGRHRVRMIMEMVAIAALPLPPETAKEAGYNASRTALHFSSTFTCLTCQQPSPESMHMLTTSKAVNADGDGQTVEGVLSKDMVGNYVQTWKLMLSTAKTVSAVFHLKKSTTATKPCTLLRAQIPRSNGQAVTTRSTMNKKSLRWITFLHMSSFAVCVAVFI